MADCQRSAERPFRMRRHWSRWPPIRSLYSGQNYWREVAARRSTWLRLGQSLCRVLLLLLLRRPPVERFNKHTTPAVSGCYSQQSRNRCNSVAPKGPWSHLFTSAPLVSKQVNDLQTAVIISPRYISDSCYAPPYREGIKRCNRLSVSYIQASNSETETHKKFKVDRNISLSVQFGLVRFKNLLVSDLQPAWRYKSQ